MVWLLLKGIGTFFFARSQCVNVESDFYALQTLITYITDVTINSSYGGVPKGSVLGNVINKQHEQEWT